MIPYIQIPDLVLVPARIVHGTWPETAVAIHPFGALVALAIWVGIGLVIHQAKRQQLPYRHVQSYLAWILLGGFLGGHLFDWTFYDPIPMRLDPLAVFRVWDGQSSFGGFVGAGIGSLAWRWRTRVKVMPYAEIVASSFPCAWFIGRVGCFVAHDHPGRLSSAFWAVAYPGGARLDMGLMEAIATLPLAVTFLWLRRKGPAPGTFLGIMCTYYAPLRFWLDFSRASDVASADTRYWQLTPAQWGCVGLLVIGLSFLAGARARAPKGPKRTPSLVHKPI